jgi:hypothetical protein
MTKIAGFRSESGSISLRHGAANPDPDPYQNVMDLQHCHWLYAFREDLSIMHLCLENAVAATAILVGVAPG